MDTKCEPTDHERDRLLHQHLPYEIRMFRAAGTVLAQPRPEPDDHAGTTRYYMAIEMYLLHLRNLYAFFFDERVRKRDALARHVLGGDARWRRDTGVRKTPALQDARRLADKLVAHLNYERVDILAAGTEIAWAGSFRDMESVLSAFQAALEKRQLSLPTLSSVIASESPPQSSVTTVTKIAATDAPFRGWLQATDRGDDSSE